MRTQLTMALVAAVGATAFAVAPTDPVVCESVPGVNDDPCPEVLTHWSYEPGEGGGGYDQVAASAATADDQLLVSVGTSQLADGRTGGLTLVTEVATGDVRHALLLDEGERTAVQDLVTIGDDTAVVDVDVDGRATLVAWDLATGAERWRITPAAAGAEYVRIADLAVSSDGTRVHVALSRSGQAVAGSVDGHVLAIDASSGAVLWSHQLDDLGRWGAYRALATAPDGGVVAVGSAETQFGDGLAVVADRLGADGTVAWESRADGPATGFNAHDEAQQVVVSPDGATVLLAGTSVDPGPNDQQRSVLAMALDAADGSERWRDRQPSAVDPGGAGITDVAALALSADGMTMAIGSLSCAVLVFECVATFTAHDAATGAASWSHVVTGAGIATLPHQLAFTDDGSTLRALSSSVGAANYLLFNTGTGPLPSVSVPNPGFSVLTELDAATGAVTWESRYNSGDVPTDYGYAGGMVAVDGAVLTSHVAAPLEAHGPGGTGNGSDVEVLRWNR